MTVTNELNKHKGISIVIPVLNERDNINELIQRIVRTMVLTRYRFEIVFINDHSTDNTRKTIEKYADVYPIRVYNKKGSPGKAQSILEGVSRAKYDLICMIDGDLQYPPEAIKLMMGKIEEGNDVVIARRKDLHTSLKRKIASKVFNYIFCKFLHGLNYDVQSGLKIFKKEIIERVTLKPFSWSFDLEFLLTARAAGYKLAETDIVFEKRFKGKSKINLIRASLQIALSAVLLRFNNDRIIPFHKNKLESVGQGFHYKTQEFVHYSDLQMAESAFKTLHYYQIIFALSFITLYMAGLIFNWRDTLIVTVAIITVIYFIDLVFNFYLIYRSFTKSPELTVDDDEIKTVKEWPKYTIFCPLYREWVVVNQFVEAIEKLDYPKDKLQVLLLLEEDDKETIEHIGKLKLPTYFETIIVPHGFPKTKPKACNYGLRYATGEYAVIYDAEDIPDPLQLKKAVLGFEKLGEKVICIQAKLNYYNKSQNLLTRLFTAEYSLWFDLILTGLQSLNAPIPLGGTSNHFRTNKLVEVEGWDSFNVTEDCDLGIRLAKRGYQTAIIDSVTLEEANSDIMNWINQRSRWIKGYIQTYLVHMRNPALLLQNGFRAQFLTFQLVVGGKIFSLFINPIMWTLTILYFSFRASIGTTIEQFFPGPVLYMGVFSLIVGNFLYVYYYMIGCAKRKQYDLIKYIYLIPFYWVFISFAAWKGLIQLVFNPYYWPKTIHGLHINSKEEVSETIVKRSFWQGISFPKVISSKFRVELSKKHLSGGLFIFSNAVASIFSFLFSAYLGRSLTLEDFALVSLINGLISLVSIIFGSLGITMSYRINYLMGKTGEKSAISFWSITRKRALFISLILSTLWISISPLLLGYFQLSEYTPLLLFSPILLVNLASSADKGLLFSKFNFKALSVLTIGEPLIKFGFAVLMVTLGYKNLAYSSIPFAAVGGFLIGWAFIYKFFPKEKSENENKSYSFPYKFFFGSLILGISVIIFLNLDVILAKHYLNAKDAGLYALTALIGKMIFFLASLAAPFTIPIVSKYEGANKDTKKFLNLTVLATLALSLPALFAVTILGKYILPIMFGQKAIATFPYIAPVAFGMVCFSLARVYSDYYLAKKYYSFPLTALALGCLQLVALEFFHGNIWAFVIIMSSVWTLYFIFTFLLHYYSDQVKIIENNILDFLNLFVKLKEPKARKRNKLRILIFNWRDTKHKWAGGAEVYIYELAKRWVRDGNSVTIFCGNTGAPRNEVLDGIQVYRRGGFYMVYLWAFIYYVFKFRGKYDVIIDSENGIPFFTPIYAREKTFLLIHHVHQEVFRKSLHWPLSWIASTLEGKVMPFVYRDTEVITVSPSSKEEIKKHKLTTKEPHIIYNGVDLNLFKPATKSKTPIILYLGRLQQYKSLDVLIKAAKLVLDKMPKVKFVIAGEGEDKTNLFRLVNSFNLQDKIKFLGKVTHEEKVKLMQQAWLFINPSLMEGWGITTIEANACGTPAIASNVPGLRDSVNNPHTGMLVKYGDVEELARIIIKLIKSNQLRTKMAKEANIWAKNYSWDRSSEKLITLLKNQDKSFIFNTKLLTDEQ